ncbi:beta-1,3-glucanosyltransferase [Metschnikowia bicuspidata]|uniref:1,3-beta-glucanosyltransferase n=1 Tax=Metschnikowia bicuspidata TaxID=27322 RepID=A0A4P9ZH82_9ASCO|nr:beta-1,3-glucanosyltransferase [Metschnikowia bicuspidata]
MRNFGLLLSLYFAVASVAADLPQIEVIGNKFFFKNNQSQFLMRGIAYQQNTAERINSTGDVTGFNDPLADSAACKRDVEYMINTNTNVLRVYAVDPTKNHDECMKIFSDAGIYIIADLSEPKLSVNRDNPEWNLSLYKRYTSVVDMFAKYKNVLGFFAGNEVSNNNTNTEASVFVKAAVRDMKSYIKSKGWSYPVGYSSNDDADIRVPIAQYFSCGSLEERADFFGINMYEWCGESTFKESGYEARTEEYKNLTIPVFFSEYGCNTVQPRKFRDIPVLFSNQMTHVWSGGIMYMFFQEENNYGIVSVSGNSITTMTDYPFYSLQMNAITPSYAKASDVGASSTATFSCPSLGVNWKASPSLPPTPDQGVCECVVNSLKCVVSNGIEPKNYAALFGLVCGMVDCSSVSVNGTTGEYGSISFCDDKDKLSYVLNQYYLLQNSRADACNFNGSASLVKLASMASSCSSIISSVSQNSRATGSANRKGPDTSQGTRSTSSRRNSGSGVQPASTNSLAALLSLVLAVFGGITSFIV